MTTIGNYDFVGQDTPNMIITVSNTHIDFIPERIDTPYMYTIPLVKPPASNSDIRRMRQTRTGKNKSFQDGSCGDISIPVKRELNHKFLFLLTDLFASDCDSFKRRGSIFWYMG